MWAPLYVTDQPGMSVGLEFLVFRKDGGSFVGHSGGANGFTSNMTIHLDSKTGFFMAGNTDGFTAMMNAFPGFARRLSGRDILRRISGQQERRRARK